MEGLTIVAHPQWTAVLTWHLCGFLHIEHKDIAAYIVAVMIVAHPQWTVP